MSVKDTRQSHGAPGSAPELAGRDPDLLRTALRDIVTGWEKGTDIFTPINNARALLGDKPTAEKAVDLSLVNPTGEQLYTMVTKRFKSGSLPWGLASESGKAAWDAAAAELVFAPDTIMARYSPAAADAGGLSIPTWRERMKTTAIKWKTGEGKSAVEFQFMQQEIDDLRAALAQTEANSDDIAAHLGAMTKTATELRAANRSTAVMAGGLSDASAAEILIVMREHMLAWGAAREGHVELDIEDDDKEGYALFAGECLRFIAAQLPARPTAMGAGDLPDREIMERWEEHRLQGEKDNTPFLRVIVDFARHWMARPTASGAGSLSAAGRDVLAERQRQVDVKDWTPEHDDHHPSGEIAAFAAVYAMPPEARQWPANETGYGPTFGIALCPQDWQPRFGDRRRELVKAGALILAEIERIDRTTANGAGDRNG